jgi:hypothetical protein
MAQLRAAFDDADLRGVLLETAAMAADSGIFLHDGGQRRAIRVLLPPLVLSAEQAAWVLQISSVILHAHVRLAELYSSPKVREVLRLTPEEEAWLLRYRRAPGAGRAPLFGRLDAMFDPTATDWRSTLQFIEPNLSSLGGLDHAAACSRIARQQAACLLGEECGLRETADPRFLLAGEIKDLLSRRNLGRGLVALVDPKYVMDGPVGEQDGMAAYLGIAHGLDVIHGDPAELTLAAGGATYEGRRVDLVYRDAPAWDLAQAEAEGRSFAGMRRLFSEDAVISPIEAEVDQKSCFEILTDPEMAPLLFTSREVDVFRRHVLWTRLLGDRRTTGPDGAAIPHLLEYARSKRVSLIIKPNRSFGGQGVLIGESSPQQEWDSAIEAAVRGEERWVVQQRARPLRLRLPFLQDEGALDEADFNVVLGFIPSRHGLGVVGRASIAGVVNVSQGGGFLPALLGDSNSMPPGT